jgi:hypothetical protein
LQNHLPGHSPNLFALQIADIDEKTSDFLENAKFYLMILDMLDGFFTIALINNHHF